MGVVMIITAFQSGSVAHLGATYRAPSLNRNASAGRQARKRHAGRELARNAFACLLIAALIDVALINFLLFPDCNRTTRDCFLVQHLWGAK